MPRFLLCYLKRKKSEAFLSIAGQSGKEMLNMMTVGATPFWDLMKWKPMDAFLQPGGWTEGANLHKHTNNLQIPEGQTGGRCGRRRLYKHTAPWPGFLSNGYHDVKNARSIRNTMLWDRPTRRENWAPFPEKNIRGRLANSNMGHPWGGSPLSGGDIWLLPSLGLLCWEWSTPVLITGLRNRKHRQGQSPRHRV